MARTEGTKRRGPLELMALLDAVEAIEDAQPKRGKNKSAESRRAAEAFNRLGIPPWPGYPTREHKNYPLGSTEYKSGPLRDVIPKARLLVKKHPASGQAFRRVLAKIVDVGVPDLDAMSDEQWLAYLKDTGEIIATVIAGDIITGVDSRENVLALFLLMDKFQATNRGALPPEFSVLPYFYRIEQALKDFYHVENIADIPDALGLNIMFVR